MPSTVNFIPTPYIFLKVNSFILSNINSSGVINNTLLRIPVNANYGEVINYRPAEVNKYLVNRNSLNEIELGLFDADNNALAIGSGVELQAILKFEYINIPVAPQYDLGTIQHYFKENPIKPTADNDEEGLGDV